MIVLVSFLCLISVATSSPLIGCRDESNKIVDFAYLYSLPEDPPAQTAFKSDGYRYTFMTSSSLNGLWSDSTRNISEKNSIPGYTLSQMYGRSDIMAILYNDQTPSEDDDSSKGHSKGVIVTDGTQGFWIIHSIPRFPPELSTGSYGYPPTGAKYGQNYLCVTMKAGEIEKAISQLETNQVQVYSSQLPASLKKAFPNAVRLLEGFQVLKLVSSAGVTFTSFAKSSNFKKDLYQDLLAPQLGDISVESWKFGANFLTSNCSTPQKVYTISKLEIPEIGSFKFSTSRDHSKWAVSTTEANGHWICVGDINRFETQFKRGGGCLCQSSKPISEAYRKIIADTDACK